MDRNFYEFSKDLGRAISTTRQFLFSRQHPDGYWVGELEGGPSLQSDTILLLSFLGQEDTDLTRACAEQLRATQQADGGWGMFTGARSDVTNTIKAYFALKLTGHKPSTEYMQKAQTCALQLGGADQIDDLARFFLALLGQIPYSICPVVFPHAILFPKAVPGNIHALSDWAKTIFVPLSIISALAPVRPISAEKGIKELFVQCPSRWSNPLPLTGTFCVSDWILKLCRQCGLTPFRNKALNEAKRWILTHCQKSEGHGAFFHSLLWTWIALKALGYDEQSQEWAYCQEQLEGLVLHDRQRQSVRIQPCKSTGQDTNLVLKALMSSGLTIEHPAIRKGVQWTRSRQVKEEDAGCRFGNPFYPDCDDHATSLLVLAGRFDKAGTALPKIASRGNITLGERKGQNKEGTDSFVGLLPPDLRLMIAERADSLDEAKRNTLDLVETSDTLERGFRRLLAMQNSDGSWSEFERENCGELFGGLPFAGPKVMNGSGAPDLTGRVMESLGCLGFRVGQHVQIDRAVRYMRQKQNPDGSWFGRWGGHSIHGTWQALTGLMAVGVSATDSAITAGASWLLSRQDTSGGWGEVPDSYTYPSLRGRGVPTISQTAWAVMGLIEAGKVEHSAVRCGIRFLLDRQREDGTWFEREYTGAGIPLMLYLKHHYYSVYFPLMALSLYAVRTRQPKSCSNDKETILRMHRLRVYSGEDVYCNTMRPDELKTNDIDRVLPEVDIPRNRSGGPPKLSIFFG